MFAPLRERIAFGVKLRDAVAVFVECGVVEGRIDLGFARVDLGDLAFDPRDVRFELRFDLERRLLRGFRPLRRAGGFERAALAFTRLRFVGIVSAVDLAPAAVLDPEHAVA